MYMRFRGGGVGHSPIPIKNHDPPPEAEGDTINVDEREVLDVAEVPSLRVEELESESDSESDEELEEDEMIRNETGEEDELVDQDFDPEDGEGEILDVENETGYDEL